jgi:glycosyltransferase involved in cell wall biosynthesis
MRLSVYILTLNETEWIEHALAYAVTIADEIVIVDGGSTDNTLERVCAFMATSSVPITLLQHPMPDSFSQQRNYALAHCTGDWILHMDADERYTTGLKDRLLPTLDSIPNEIVGFSIPTYYLAVDERHFQSYDADPHIRLFRNLPNLKYVRPIHEHLALDGHGLVAHPSHFTPLERRVIRYQPDIRLLHYGSLRSDTAYAAWRDRWQRFAALSSQYGINVDALVRHPPAIGSIPEVEIPQI